MAAVPGTASPKSSGPTSSSSPSTSTPTAAAKIETKTPLTLIADIQAQLVAIQERNLGNQVFQAFYDFENNYDRLISAFHHGSIEEIAKFLHWFHFTLVVWFDEAMEGHKCVNRWTNRFIYNAVLGHHNPNDDHGGEPRPMNKDDANRSRAHWAKVGQAMKRALTIAEQASGYDQARSIEFNRLEDLAEIGWSGWKIPYDRSSLEWTNDHHNFYYSRNRLKLQLGHLHGCVASLPSCIDKYYSELALHVSKEFINGNPSGLALHYSDLSNHFIAEEKSSEVIHSLESTFKTRLLAIFKSGLSAKEAASWQSEVNVDPNNQFAGQMDLLYCSDDTKTGIIVELKNTPIKEIKTRPSPPSGVSDWDYQFQYSHGLLLLSDDEICKLELKSYKIGDPLTVGARFENAVKQVVLYRAKAKKEAFRIIVVYRVGLHRVLARTIPAS